MGDLVRQDFRDLVRKRGLVRKDDQVGLQRADRNVDATLMQGTAAVHYCAHQVYREIVSRLVEETKAIEDERTFNMVAPHVEATAEQLGGRLLDIANHTTDAMEARAEEWKRNRR